MGKRKPRRQLPGRLLWSRAVEGHHGRGHAWRSAKLGTPTVASGRDLDLVHTSGDEFFEMMNCHRRWGSCLTNEVLILRIRHS